ncbi:MAG: tetratricopeptide repeat protein [Betaproteobacteria bacterium]|nr:tetratricopeptide repeat protein [Betaproteobacteria bacterium]NBQ79112.1 tetratricopeptide repeat protein [Betaproteobacteria bacterium]NBS39724.1 tetratricopeptide repeat protein [Betaproteobacteria bacterium]NBT05258.1 tetratricopeptide repeat protein [Betaproteobacteria bacterium]NBT82087.1 tetratricopeptide repeat protein [Betaproteobacteria bacterium]
MRLAAVGLCTLLPVVVLGAALNPVEEAERSLEQARRAIADGALDQAELKLERVLMFMPEHAEARVMLASLMAQLGRLETALLLLESLIDDPRTADDYRQRLRGIYALIAQAPRLASLSQSSMNLESQSRGQSYWRGELGFGQTSNPLSRTSASELPLTIADSVINLPLNDRPIRGNLIQASVARLGQNQGFDLNLASISPLGAQAPQANAARLSAWGPVVGPVFWQAQAQQSLDHQRRNSLGLGLSEARHRFTLTAFNEPTRDEAGQFLRYEQRLLPVLGGIWSVSLERGRYTGRLPDYWRAAASAEYSVGKQRFLVVNWGLQGDFSGYSPLLENNSRRRLDTRSVAYEQHIAISKQKVFVLRALATERRSNLAIFSFRDVGLQVSFVSTWL